MGLMNLLTKHRAPEELKFLVSVTISRSPLEILKGICCSRRGALRRSAVCKIFVLTIYPLASSAGAADAAAASAAALASAATLASSASALALALAA